MTAKKITHPFTAVDNRIFYLQEILSPSAFCMLIRIYRMTEGYGGKPKALSNSFLQTLCNMSKNTVSRAVKELENQQLIHTEKRTKATTIYSVNLAQVYKIHEEMKAKSEQSIPYYDHDDNSDDDKHGHNVTMTVPYYDHDDDKHGHIMGTTKENTIKENLKENTIEHDSKNDVINFEGFWNAYGKGRAKGKCEKKWLQLSASDKKGVMNHVVDYVISTPDKKYRKDPYTYLNGKGWLDEIIQPQSQQNNSQVNNHAEQKPKQSAADLYTDSLTNAMQQRYGQPTDPTANDGHSGNVYDMEKTV